jgi:phosphatidylserine/phosphatidylglycerophosphate/cardiolipin synthase-like enzyme
MHCSQQNVNINIGKAVGNELEDYLLKAKKRIYVVSPWIHPRYSKLLLDKKKQGLDVRLITTTSYNNKSHFKGLLELVQQKKKDKSKEILELSEKRNKFLIAGIIGTIISIPLIFVGIGFLTILLSIGAIAYSFSIKPPETEYYYDTLIPIKICKTKYSDYTEGDFLHAKIFIVDNIIGLGSANFTSAGMFENFETLIIFKDEKVISETIDEFETLWASPFMNEKNVQELGAWYHEDKTPEELLENPNITQQLISIKDELKALAQSTQN